MWKTSDSIKKHVNDNIEKQTTVDTHEKRRKKKIDIRKI